MNKLKKANILKVELNTWNKYWLTPISAKNTFIGWYGKDASSKNIDPTIVADKIDVIPSLNI